VSELVAGTLPVARFCWDRVACGFNTRDRVTGVDGAVLATFRPLVGLPEVGATADVTESRVRGDPAEPLLVFLFGEVPVLLCPLDVID